jgi:hypothetical protein
MTCSDGSIYVVRLLLCKQGHFRAAILDDSEQARGAWLGSLLATPAGAYFVGIAMKDKAEQRSIHPRGTDIDVHFHSAQERCSRSLPLSKLSRFFLPKQTIVLFKMFKINVSPKGSYQLRNVSLFGRQGNDYAALWY